MIMMTWKIIKKIFMIRKAMKINFMMDKMAMKKTLKKIAIIN
jgi:hypothetical protein